MNDMPPTDGERQHAHCLICGGLNPRSLGLRFHSERADEVRCRVQCTPELQGYSGLVHGGVIAALLDAAMTHCLFRQDVLALTGSLSVKYIQPVEMNSLLDLRAWMEKGRGKVYYLRAEIRRDDTVLARSWGTFVRRTGKGGACPSE